MYRYPIVAGSNLTLGTFCILYYIAILFLFLLQVGITIHLYNVLYTEVCSNVVYVCSSM